MTDDPTSIQDLARNYQPPQSAHRLVRDTTIVLIVGPSGAGKNSIMDGLVAKGGYTMVVSNTTRPPRMNHGQLEENGHEYFFVSYAAMQKMLVGEELVEAKPYDRHVYATSLAEIQRAYDQKLVALADIEVEGAEEYKKLSAEVMAVFIVPPSAQDLVDRIRTRHEGDDFSETDLQQRLHIAVSELKKALVAGYFSFVINDDLEKAIGEVDLLTRYGQRDAAEEAAAERQARTVLEQLQSMTA